MKFVKYLVLVLLVVVILGAGYVAVQPSEFDVKRSRVIKAPPAVAFNMINDYKTWEKWGPWKEEDSTMTFSYADKTMGEGASYSWEGKDGKGSMETVFVQKNDSLSQKITFEGMDPSDVYWSFKPTDEGTEVTWGMKGNMNFMFKLFATFSGGVDKMMGPMYEKGLENIDNMITEEMKKYEISYNGVIEHGGGYYLYNTVECKQDDMEKHMKRLFSSVMMFMEENNIAMAGIPFTLYKEWNEEQKTTIFSACFPVKEKIVVQGGDILCGYMNPQKAFKTTLKGDYKNLEEAWMGAMKVMKKQGVGEKEGGEPFEVYLNSPQETPNPADWITEIYIPIEENASM